jgi:hypothetical protein
MCIWLRCHRQRLAAGALVFALLFGPFAGSVRAEEGTPPEGGQISWAAENMVSGPSTVPARAAVRKLEAAGSAVARSLPGALSTTTNLYRYYMLSVGVWREPNDYAHRNYCGPASTQVALDARLPWWQIPDIDTLGREENIDPNWGVAASAIQRVLNTRLGTTWYWLNSSSSASDLALKIRVDLSNQFAMVTGLKTGGMPGWGTRNVNHIVTVYGYYRSSTGQTEYVYYTETAGSVAGYNGTYQNAVSLASFWRYVQANNVQVW